VLADSGISWEIGRVASLHSAAYGYTGGVVVMYLTIQALLLVLKFTVAPELPWWIVLFPTILVGAIALWLLIFTVALSVTLP